MPHGDVLVHCGDITAHGHLQEVEAFVAWLAAQPHRHKLFIAGNHDCALEVDPAAGRAIAARAADNGVTYLEDTGCCIDGMTFWGSPITPRHMHWAFMRDPGPDIQRHWDLVPDDTDVLITHGPPWGVLDTLYRQDSGAEHTGCPSLLASLSRIQPRLHLFGHIHEGHGMLPADDSPGNDVTAFHNVATMNEFYCIANAPVIIELCLIHLIRIPAYDE